MTHLARIRKPVLLALLTATGAVATGAAFAGWSNHGAEIFLNMASAGLAWCL
jgi:hypothetical protein